MLNQVLGFAVGLIRRKAALLLFVDFFFDEDNFTDAIFRGQDLLVMIPKLQKSRRVG